MGDWPGVRRYGVIGLLLGWALLTRPDSGLFALLQLPFQPFDAHVVRLPQLDAAARGHREPVALFVEWIAGVPLDPDVTEFLDEVPGKGSSRYFYRVRAVDAAGNASEWSDVSAPFHVVDTTPPEAVRQLQVFPGDRTATLVWAVPADRRIQKFKIYRNEGEETASFNFLAAIPHAIVCTPGQNPMPTDCVELVRSRPLEAIGGSLTLPAKIEVRVSAGTAVSQIAAQVAAQTRVILRDAPAQAPNLFDPITGRLLTVSYTHLTLPTSDLV